MHYIFILISDSQCNTKKFSTLNCENESEWQYNRKIVPLANSDKKYKEG